MRRAVMIACLSLVAAAARPDNRLAAYKQAVANTMRDPDAVQFRDVQAVTTDDGKPALYGLLNAKNGFGAYTGYQPFCAVMVGTGPRYVSVVSTAHELGISFVLKQCSRPLPVE